MKENTENIFLKEQRALNTLYKTERSHKLTRQLQIGKRIDKMTKLKNRCGLWTHPLKFIA